MTAEERSIPPVSVAISLDDPQAVSTILAAARHPEKADSVKLELRGSAQDIASVLVGLRDTSSVSAVLSVRKS